MAAKKKISTKNNVQLDITSIKKISVSRLFGYYDYELDTLFEEGGEYTRFTIFYGDNGAGKTTILRLIFSLLSSVSRRGDKSYVASVPFRKLEIDFDEGTVVKAYRDADEIVGSYWVDIIRPKRKKYTIKLNATDDNMIRVGPDNPGIDELHERLADLNVSIYFLPDDRRVRNSDYGDEADDIDDAIYFEEEGRVVRRLSKHERSHHLNVEPIIKEVTEWVKKEIIKGSYSGEENTNSIYLKLADELASANESRDRITEKKINEFIDRLLEIESRSKRFAEYGITTTIPSKKFISLLKSADSRSRRSVLSVLKLRADGVEARLDALDEIMNIISTFVDTVNEFLHHKRIIFSIGSGVFVVNKEGMVIETNRLSSGEKQLLLLLCNALLARERATIFLIDEPELSLNVKWQRKLVQALDRCSVGSKVQFVMATHSLELLSKYRSRVRKLEEIL